MSRIQNEPSIPGKPPAPKRTPHTGNAPPFTPAEQKPQQKPKQTPQQKLRKPAVSSTANAAQAQRQHATNLRQARATRQAAQNERRSAAWQDRMREAPAQDPAADPNASPCFDKRNPMLPDDCSAESDEAPDAMANGSAGVSVEQLTQAAALDEQLDCTALAHLLPTGENDGIFDVVLPTGDRLGVVVSGRSSSLSYLLSPATEKFGSRLRRHRMELEAGLEQLTHRNVNITVL